jgi:hypothetical protein
VTRDFRENVVEGDRLPAVKRISRIAVAAAQRTSGQADEYRRQPDAARFTLQRMENFGDAKPILREPGPSGRGLIGYGHRETG